MMPETARIAYILIQWQLTAIAPQVCFSLGSSWEDGISEGCSIHPREGDAKEGSDLMLFYRKVAPKRQT